MGFNLSQTHLSSSQKPNMASPSSFLAIGLFSILSVLTRAGAAVPLFVFGDSLADNGNNNNLSVPLLDKANFPYNGIDFPGKLATGRFSNGFNGVDYIGINLELSIF
jgi:phospholipase/lecithinase/hemolysin